MQGAVYDGRGPALSEINGLFNQVFGTDADAAGLEYWDKTNLSTDQLRGEFNRFSGGVDPTAQRQQMIEKIKQQRGAKDEADRKFLFDSIRQGDNLAELYSSGTYGDAVALMNDLGINRGKDQSMIIPANPVGYSGGFKFDPVFGSSVYRDLASQVGKAFGLTDEQIRAAAGELAIENWYSGGQTKNIMGFSDYGKILTDKLAQTAGVDPSTIKPVYDTIAQVDSKFRQAGAVESQSSGVLKQVGADLAKLGPIGTIAIAAALGPAGAGLMGTVGAAATAAAAPSLLQGDFEGALKSGALAGLSAGVFKGLDASISNSVGGGITGDIVGGAAKGAITGGTGALISGGDFGEGLIKGAITGGVVSGVTSGVNALTAEDPQAIGYDGTKNTASVGGIDDSSSDLGKTGGFSVGYDGMADSPSVGGIDDSNNDLGKSIDYGTGYDGEFGSPRVGGIDDSNNDLGKSTDRLIEYGGAAPKTGLGNVVGPIVGGLISSQLNGGNDQPSGGSVQPAPTVKQPETTQPRGNLGPLPTGAFTTKQSGSAGNQKAARLDLGSLLSGSKFAENNKYLRGFF